MPTYRTNGAWGSGIGINLTPAQVDGNFYELRTDLDDVIANPPTADGIVSVSQSGFTLTFHTTLGNELGPIALPVLYTVWRGEWAPFTLYNAADQFKVTDRGIFAVLQDHTSAATFDPAAAAGSPLAPLYLELIEVSSLHQVSTQSGDYTLALTDADAYIRAISGTSPPTPMTFTIPDNATVAFVIGTTVAFEQTEDGGDITIDTAGGVTLNFASTYTPVTNGQFAVAQIKKVEDDAWTLFGNLVPA